jgi:AcrR family transcriptional regulator
MPVLDAAPSEGRRRGPRKGDLKEAAILDTAWRLLAQKPLSLVTIEDLAAGAGISRSTFYFYFESKEAVILALAGRIAGEIRGAFDVVFQAGQEGDLADLRRGIAAYMVRWREKGPALRAMDALAETDAALRAFWARISGELLDEAARSLEAQRGLGRALAAPPSSKDLVRVLFAMLWRTGYELSLQSPSRTEEQRIVDALTAVFVRSCFGVAD